VAARSKETILAMLKTFEASLDRASTSIRQQPGAAGGRKPLRGRHYFIINLADLWSSLRKPVSMGNSHFAAFVTNVFELVGWPTIGLIAALPEAVADWRHLAKKTQ
jgi:hypothetical protein